MGNNGPTGRCQARFVELYGKPAEITASAPGRLEVLGNHTDYNFGLTQSQRTRLFAADRLAGARVGGVIQLVRTGDGGVVCFGRLHAIGTGRD